MELQADSFTLQSPMRKSCHYPNFRAERAFFVASRRLTVAVDFNPRWWCAADDSRLASRRLNRLVKTTRRLPFLVRHGEVRGNVLLLPLN
jgi:hypothetical protein